MRKNVQYSLIAVIAVLAVATIALFVQYRKTSADYAETKIAEETARTNYAQTIDAIAEIQDSLNAISVGDPSAMSSGNQEALSGAKGQEALDRIALLRASIVRNKERILGLEASLKQRGQKVRGLERLIANLKQDVKDKETLITTLSTSVDSLQNTVTGLSTEIAQNIETLKARDEALEMKRREAATIYYVVGTTRDLKRSGIVEARGGLLGIGKTLQPSGTVAQDGFTPLDTDQETVIQVPSEKVKILSAQPPSSYEVRVVEGHTEIHITDPQQFRTIKQLVIQTA
jgi:hypothetical protein